MSEKHKSKLAAFAILERDGKVLLARRANTGYADGMYQMPSGHIEEGELPVFAAAREAKEEVGVEINVTDMEFVHVSFRVVDNYVDFFFRTTKWSGDITNNEPEKCDDVSWFPLDNLPENTVPVVRQVLEDVKKGITLSQIN